MKDLGPIEKNGKLLKEHLWECDCGQVIIEAEKPTKEIHDCKQKGVLEGE